MINILKKAKLDYFEDILIFLIPLFSILLIRITIFKPFVIIFFALLAIMVLINFKKYYCEFFRKRYIPFFAMITWFAIYCLFYSHSNAEKIMYIIGFFIMFSVLMLVSNFAKLKYLLMGLLFLVYVVLVIGILEALFGNYLFYSQDIFVTRQTVLHLHYSVITFFNVNNFVYFIVVSLPFALSQTKSFANRLILTLLSAIIVFNNESIMGIMSIITLICIFYIYKNDFISIEKIKTFVVRHKIISTTFVLISVFIFCLIIFPKILKLPAIYTRLNLLIQSISLMQNNLLLGYGIGGAVQQLSIPPHNLFITILIDFGLIGFLIFLLFYIIPIVYLNRQNPKSNYLIIRILKIQVILFVFYSIIPSGAHVELITWIFFGILYCVSLRVEFGGLQIKSIVIDE